MGPVYMDNIHIMRIFDDVLRCGWLCEQFQLAPPLVVYTPAKTLGVSKNRCLSLVSQDARAHGSR